MYNMIMESAGKTYTSNELEFAIFCIENVAKKLNKNSVEIYDLLNNSELLNNYVIGNYDILHTQGKGYITDDIIDTMKEEELI